MKEDFRIEFEDDGIGYIGKVTHIDTSVVPYFNLSYIPEGSADEPKELQIEWSDTWVQKKDAPKFNETINNSFILAAGKEIENYYAAKIV
jgi:hypothetical protein